VNVSNAPPPPPPPGGGLASLYPGDVGIENDANVVFYHPSDDGSVQGAPYRIGINTEWAPYGQRIWLPKRGHDVDQ